MRIGAAGGKPAPRAGPLPSAGAVRRPAALVFLDFARRSCAHGRTAGLPCQGALSMTAIREPARDVPVAFDADVCVIGGSCTGVFAAVAAARLGARAAVVEALGLFGGTATAGLVCVWHSSMDTANARPIWAGLTMETVERLRRRGEVTDRGPNPDMHYVFSPPALAVELDRLVVEAGVRPFLHARFAAPVMGDDGRVAAAVIEDKTGRRAVRARFFIDASGDADLAHRAGLPTFKPPRLQPPTACAVFQGLAHIREQNPDFTLRRLVFDPARPEALRPGFLWGADLPAEDLHMVAGTRVHGADCADADQLTQAEIEGRRQVRAIHDLVRRCAPGGEEVRLVAVPAQIGIRQTRQARSLHRLTEEEVLSGRRFDDAIANGSYRVDVHTADGEGLLFRYLDGREVTVRADGTRREGRWRAPAARDPTFYQVPYRCLVPQGARNVLVAGRCLDADEGAFGAARVMVNCNQMGQAAGVAAHVALDRGLDAAAVDPAEVRRALAAQGAVVI
jgi:hypothetical protein